MASSGPAGAPCPVNRSKSPPKPIKSGMAAVIVAKSAGSQQREPHPMSESMSAPPAGPEKHYRDQLAKGQFQIQRCQACARAVFYPRMVCPHCGSDQLAWATPSGKGTVYSTTVVRRRPEQGGDYNVALIDLEEGVRLMSRVQGIAPDAVSIGMAVQADVADIDGEKTVVFRQAGGCA